MTTSQNHPVIHTTINVYQGLNLQELLITRYAEPTPDVLARPSGRGNLLVECTETDLCQEIAMPLRARNDRWNLRPVLPI